MVVCRLDEILWEKRLKLSDIARKTGIDYSTLQRLRHNKGRGIQYNTLEALCRALECSPGDILQIEDR